MGTWCDMNAHWIRFLSCVFGPLVVDCMNLMIWLHHVVIVVLHIRMWQGWLGCSVDYAFWMPWGWIFIV